MTPLDFFSELCPLDPDQLDVVQPERDLPPFLVVLRRPHRCFHRRHGRRFRQRVRIQTTTSVSKPDFPTAVEEF